MVAGMSGSPVYIDGKLAGALSLKFGQFTQGAAGGRHADRGHALVARGRRTAARQQSSRRMPVLTAGREASGSFAGAERVRRAILCATRMGPHAWRFRPAAFLEPIASPLVFSGFLPPRSGNSRLTGQPYGMVATPGGSAERSAGRRANQRPATWSAWCWSRAISR